MQIQPGHNAHSSVEEFAGLVRSREIPDQVRKVLVLIRLSL